MKKPVENKRHPRHVSAVFQYGNKAEEYKKDGDIVKQGVNAVHKPQGEGADERLFYESGGRQEGFREAPDLGQHGPCVIREVVSLHNGKVIKEINNAYQDNRPQKPVADEFVSLVCQSC